MTNEEIDYFLEQCFQRIDNLTWKTIEITQQARLLNAFKRDNHLNPAETAAMLDVYTACGR